MHSVGASLTSGDSVDARRTRARRQSTPSNKPVQHTSRCADTITPKRTRAPLISKPKHMQAPVSALHQPDRWRQTPLRGTAGWLVEFKDQDDTWNPRYEIRRSELMTHVCGNTTPTHDAMYGLYASREYVSNEAITVYTGTDIGSANGNEDDYAGYKAMDRMTQPSYDADGNAYDGGGGRHVMQIGNRLIDGANNSFTGAQYANSAYRVPSKWMNKAEMKAGGTIRVKKNCKIKKGEEILFAYHHSYWRRWGTRTRGRPKQQQQENATVPEADRQPVANDHNSSELTTATITESNGIRVVPPIVPTKVGKVGRPSKKPREPTPPRANKRQARQYTWCASSRDEFNLVQQSNNVYSDAPGQYKRQRFERGEGGGVT